MKSLSLHPWDVSPREAIRIQRELAAKVVVEDRFGEIRTVAGADISVDGTRGYAGVFVYRYPELIEIERVSFVGPLRFPYVPGLLAFREGPILLEAFRKLKNSPDLILFDGQGIAHPRGLGIASHMGLILDTPSIGCAKSRLVGEFRELSPKKGEFTALEYQGRTVGAVLRTREGVRPIFVSPGHRVGLETSVKVVMNCVDRFRIPTPTREADRFVSKVKEGEVRTNLFDRGSKNPFKGVGVLLVCHTLLW